MTVCLRSSHPRPCTALDSCQLLGSVKHPLLQTSPFLWDLQGPPQARWNRQAGQGGHQAQLKCPLVFRAHGHSRRPAPRPRAPIPWVQLIRPKSAALTQCNLPPFPTLPLSLISCHQNSAALSLLLCDLGQVTSQACFSPIWRWRE